VSPYNRSRDEDWIKSRSWDFPDVSTLRDLRRMLAGVGRPYDPKTGLVGPGQVIIFLGQPSAEPIPDALLAETVAWLRGYGYDPQKVLPRRLRERVPNPV
jgi:hypothetical protein